MNILRYLIQIVVQLMTLVVIIHAVSTYIFPPYNSVRIQLDKIVNPFLNPIRKVVPVIGNFDFSPVILIILLQVIEYLLLRFISIW